MKTLPILSAGGLTVVLAVVAACHIDELLTAPPDPAAAASASPTELAFVEQPSNAMRDSTIKPPVQIAARDSEGNTTTSFTGFVRVALGNDGSALGNARLGGTETVRAVDGVATFTDLSIDQLGNDYTLTAAFAGGPDVAESAPFDITATPSPAPTQSESSTSSPQSISAVSNGPEPGILHGSRPRI